MWGRIVILLVVCLASPGARAGTIPDEPDEPTELLEREEFEGLAELAGAFIAQCRSDPSLCSTREKAAQLGRAFLVRAQALWRLDGLVDGEAIANGFELVPGERAEWIDDLPALPDTGPSPWVVSLVLGLAGQIPIDIPGRVDPNEEPDPVELLPEPPAPPPPPMDLPPLRLWSWFGVEDFGPVTALRARTAGIGYDAHLRIPGRPLALAMQGSVGFLALEGAAAFMPPNYADWYALGGLRVFASPGGAMRPAIEVDFLVGPSHHADALVGVYAVDGVLLDGFLTLRLNARFLADLPVPRLRVGPIARLETQPVFLLRRVHHSDGGTTDTPVLSANGHWALFGAGMQVALERGAALRLDIEAGAALWGDFSAGTPMVNARFGMVFGEGLEL